jgi:hypothetical protein
MASTSKEMVVEMDFAGKPAKNVAPRLHTSNQRFVGCGQN